MDTVKLQTGLVGSESQTLLKEGLSSSAEFLASFLPEGTNKLQTAQALFQAEEYHRALKLFESTLGTADPATSFQIKQRCAECYLKLREQKLAHQMFQGIPISALSVPNLMKMGMLTRDFEGKKLAKNYFKAVVEKSPFSMEAIIELVDVGVTNEELRTWTNGLQFLAKYEYPAAISKFLELNQLFENNINILKHLALAYYRNMDMKKAVDIFKKIRTIDESYVDLMDLYAVILFFYDGDLLALNKLAHDLLVVNPQRAETWTVIAIYNEAKGKRDVAMGHIDRALALNHRNAPTYYFKAWILGFIETDEALRTYSNAKRFQPDIVTYRALVDTYIKSQNLQSALKIAKDAQKLMPNHPYALCLVPLVYVHASESKHQESARTQLLAIMKKYPKCEDAILYLAKVYAIQDKASDGINLLKSTIEKSPSPQLYTALADLHTEDEKTYDVAILHYHDALKLNPLFEPALSGLERVETKMKGNDQPQFDEEEDDTA